MNPLRRRRFCLSIGFAALALPLFAGAAVAADTALAGKPAAAPLSLAPADVGLDIRYDLLRDEAAGFKLLEKEFARDPRPHVKARYAECLLGGEAWGAPAGQEERGLALAQEALRDGSIHALRVVGWELMTGNRLERNISAGMRCLLKAAETQNPNALCTVGDVYLLGVGTPVNPGMAEYWYLQAGYFGKPHRLYRLGKVYEVGSGSARPDLAKACTLYYEASTRGSGEALRRLHELAATGEPHALRGDQLATLWGASIGDLHTSKVVRVAAQSLETNYPEDPQVLFALGRLYVSENGGFRDFKKAYALFDKATKLGSADARSQRAKLLAEGVGVKRDQVQALAEWRILERNSNAEAWSCLGYYSYWGSLKDANLPKDAALAFAYSKKAADRGDVFGQMNVAACHEFGIGTPTDYALAAKYYWTVARRGSRYAQEKVGKLISHVPH